MWSAAPLHGHSRIAHLYPDPGQLALAAERIDGPRCDHELRDFFAEPDEVAASLIRLVLARATSGVLDRLAYDETRVMLAHHLIGRCAAGRPPTPSTTRVALTVATLRRVFEHIDAGLASDLRLAQLAAPAQLSEDHFVRAFKAAVGQTPASVRAGAPRRACAGPARTGCDAGGRCRAGVGLSRCQPFRSRVPPARGQLAQPVAKRARALTRHSLHLGDGVALTSPGRHGVQPSVSVSRNATMSFTSAGDMAATPPGTRS